MEQKHRIEIWKEKIFQLIKKHRTDLVMAVVLLASIWAWTWEGTEAHQAEAKDVEPKTVAVQTDKSESVEEKTEEEVVVAAAEEVTETENETEDEEAEEVVESLAESVVDPDAKRKSKWDKELESSGSTNTSGSQTDAAAAELEAQAVAAAAEAAIVDGQYPIMGTSTITVDQMVAYFESAGVAYPSALAAGGAPDIQTFCQIFYDEAIAEGIRPEVPFAQTMKETGWLQYGGDASISQYNFSGLGTTGGGVAGNSFPDVRTGVRAQMQHLKAYATADPLNQECVDNRYEYVAKGCAPYVEWLGQQENPQGAGWATGANYGPDIVGMIHVMRGM